MGHKCGHRGDGTHLIPGAVIMYFEHLLLHTFNPHQKVEKWNYTLMNISKKSPPPPMMGPLKPITGRWLWGGLWGARGQVPSVSVSPAAINHSHNTFFIFKWNVFSNFSNLITLFSPWPPCLVWQRSAPRATLSSPHIFWVSLESPGHRSLTDPLLLPSSLLHISSCPSCFLESPRKVWEKQKYSLKFQLNCDVVN